MAGLGVEAAYSEGWGYSPTTKEGNKVGNAQCVLKKQLYTTTCISKGPSSDGLVPSMTFGLGHTKFRGDDPFSNIAGVSYVLGGEVCVLMCFGGDIIYNAPVPIKQNE